MALTQALQDFFELKEFASESDLEFNPWINETSPEFKSEENVMMMNSSVNYMNSTAMMNNQMKQIIKSLLW